MAFSIRGFASGSKSRVVVSNHKLNAFVHLSSLQTSALIEM